MDRPDTHPQESGQFALGQAGALAQSQRLVGEAVVADLVVIHGRHATSIAHTIGTAALSPPGVHPATPPCVAVLLKRNVSGEHMLPRPAQVRLILLLSAAAR
jgi:hypothetical protein